MLYNLSYGILSILQTSYTYTQTHTRICIAYTCVWLSNTICWSLGPHDVAVAGFRCSFSYQKQRFLNAKRNFITLIRHLRRPATIVLYWAVISIKHYLPEKTHAPYYLYFRISLPRKVGLLFWLTKEYYDEIVLKVQYAIHWFE